MKKIVMALLEESFPEDAFQFVQELHGRAPVQLTAAFVAESPIVTAWAVTGMPPDPLWLSPVAEADPDAYAQTKQLLGERCAAHGIPVQVHGRSPHGDIAQLRKESRFCDLLVVSHGLFFDASFSGIEWDHFASTVQELECPVVVVPAGFRFPQQNIIAYDGSASSVFALRQFYSVLPELSANPTFLVYGNDADDREVPDLALLEELARPHFPQLSITKLPGDPKTAILGRVGREEQPILVLGALGHRGLSRIFHRSFSYRHLLDQKVPVFIAHT
ncbi:MAG: hypothetical protein EOO11_12795 [Chitinophagaceae bacterium]|nr:MAG: hypothetical protein EOO11_12795 [Chitinophagaceae bacterium]